MPEWLCLLLIVLSEIVCFHMTKHQFKKLCLDGFTERMRVRKGGRHCQATVHNVSFQQRYQYRAAVSCVSTSYDRAASLWTLLWPPWLTPLQFHPQRLTDRSVACIPTFLILLFWFISHIVVDVSSKRWWTSPHYITLLSLLLLEVCFHMHILLKAEHFFVLTY